MTVADPQISEVPAIHPLDEAVINRIAAGEVVERPASAVKELVENALDAGATRIEVCYADGGKALIRVTDDGHGIAPSDLPLAVARHATSKIDGSDLLDIRSFGFRGEALASLGAVGRLRITSRKGPDAATLAVTGGILTGPDPAALRNGTVVELRDLFFATPARLKFLRTDRTEAQAIADTVRRLALAQPEVGFALRDVGDGNTGRVVFRADPAPDLVTRAAAILGPDFSENALEIDALRDGMRMTGLAALPTYSRGSAVAQYLFVNGRPVRDKLIVGALRAAYMDVLPRDRHPAVVLNILCDPQAVDVNVHPAKAEVRFRQPGIARGLIVSGLRHALAEAGHRASGTVADAMLGAMQADTVVEAPRVYQMDRSPTFSRPDRPSPTALAEAAAGFAPAPSARVEPDVPGEDRPLGAARAQVHETYIIAQTTDGVVIVDQHAAHERLVYERLKAQRAVNGVAAQALLIPEIVSLGDGADLLLSEAETLRAFGLGIEAFGPGTVAVRETPALLGAISAEALLRDILDELQDEGTTHTLESRVDAVLSRMACHGSIRSGRQMRAEEMNALLRQMEETPLSGQCNHGRPTYVKLALADIERLFGRT